MSRSPRSLYDLFQRAVAAFRAGDYETARHLFREVLIEDEEHREEARQYLARIEELQEAGGEERETGLGMGMGSGMGSSGPAGYGAPATREVESFGRPPSPLVLESTVEPPALEALRRTPHMDVDPAPPVEPGARLTVVVYTDKEAFRPGEQGDEVTIEAPPEQKEFELDVWLVVGEPFEVEGDAIQTLVIHRDRAKSEPVEFTVVRQAGAGTGDILFSALFAYKGRPCGRVSRSVPLGDTAAAKPPATDEDDPGPRLRIEATAAPPDLSVRIIATEDERAFQCVVQTPHLDELRKGKTETWRLHSVAADMVRDIMSGFTAGGLSNYARTAALRGAGQQFFEASPRIFQEAFWALTDGGKPLRTLSIVTEEPSIPWELMVPCRDSDEEDREPLGVQLLVSRWTSRDHVLPAQSVPLRDAYVVAPRDSRLASAEEEVTMVTGALTGQRIDPASVEALDTFLSQQGRTLLHFICHGESGQAGGQVLILERKEKLSTTMLRGLRGLKKSFRAAKPLVFLNACEVGRPVPALIGAGGFAEVFMALGASGVIAPLWSVKDSVAHEIAVEFYRRVKAEPETPFAEIVRDLRKKSYADGGGEDTYAAYCFYGDPLARRAE